MYVCVLWVITRGLPGKNENFLLKWRVLAHFERAGVEIALM